MARSCMCVFLMVVVPMFACAQGFQGNDDDNGDDDDTPRVDAPFNTTDAPVSAIDARVDAPISSIDAPMPPIDAPIGLPDGGTGGACTDNSQCGTGMCCFGQIMCVPGDPQPLPPPFNCIPS